MFPKDIISSNLWMEGKREAVLSCLNLEHKNTSDVVYTLHMTHGQCERNK